MTKQVFWNHYILKITKKKVKRINLRIKPDEPNIIHISIPYQISYASALQFLEQPRIQKWLNDYQKRLSKQPINQVDWYEEHSLKQSLYRQRLEELLPEIFEKWQSCIGVKANRVSIRDTRSQWGSCNVKSKNISISVWLGAYPKECIEYVVVHELVHLLEKGHNAKFYAYLSAYYPNWKEYRNQLKSRNIDEKYEKLKNEAIK